MKRVKILIASLILAASFTSCSDFLSEVPDNRTQLDSAVKIGELLVTAYPIYAYAPFTEIMSDNVWDSGESIGVIDYHRSQFKWELEERISQDSPSAYWDGCYEAIAAANEALEAIQKIDNGDGKLNALKGEALMARAYAHYMLVQLWSKAYNPATAASDIGIPYVDKPERKLIQEYSRGTVEDVYAKIEKDIVDGMPLITDNYKQPKFHFNKQAAQAFATRFYLTIGKWDQAISNSDYLMGDPIGMMRDYATFKKFGLMERFQKYTRPEMKTNLLLVTAVSTYYRYNYQSRYWITGKEKDLIFGSKTNPFGKAWTYSGGSFNGQTTYVYPKMGEYFRLDDPSAGTGIPFTNYVLLSNDEVYLNRMEALVMSNRIDEAIAGMELFAGNRTPSYKVGTDKITLAKLRTMYPNVTEKLTPFYNLTEDQALVIELILETKRREFIHEGLRWFDIKRYNIEVSHKFNTGEELILTKDDARRQLPLPLHVTAAGLPDNPRN